MKAIVATAILVLGIVASIASSANAQFARDFWEQQRRCHDGDGMR